MLKLWPLLARARTSLFIGGFPTDWPHVAHFEAKLLHGSPLRYLSGHFALTDRTVQTGGPYLFP